MLVAYRSTRGSEMDQKSGAEAIRWLGFPSLRVFPPSVTWVSITQSFLGWLELWLQWLVEVGARIGWIWNTNENLNFFYKCFIKAFVWITIEFLPQEFDRLRCERARWWNSGFFWFKLSPPLPPLSLCIGGIYITGTLGVRLWLPTHRLQQHSK